MDRRGLAVGLLNQDARPLASPYLDDLCAVYGYPYPLAFPYVPYYGYLPNNLMLVAGLDCHTPTAVENTSWGHLKALYE
jgi:hypothetical protein